MTTPNFPGRYVAHRGATGFTVICSTCCDVVYHAADVELLGSDHEAIATAAADVGACEIDPFARSVYAKNFGAPPQFADIRDVRASGIPHADLWCGGFPCQGISTAGNRGGLEDPRSGLWRDWHQLLDVVRPRVLFLENSAALAYRGLGAVLGDLSRSGYDAEWRTLSACQLGAPHMRFRLFLVAYPNGIDGALRLGNGSPRSSQVQEKHDRSSARRDWMGAASRTARGADGLPDRVERTHAIGNAVVPSVVEWIGRRIVAAFDREVS